MKKVLIIGLCVFLFLAGLDGYRMRFWESERRATYSVYLPQGVRRATEDELKTMIFRWYFDEDAVKRVYWLDFEIEFEPLSLAYYDYFLEIGEGGISAEYLAQGSDGVVYRASDKLDGWLVPYKATIEKDEGDKINVLFERDLQDKALLWVFLSRLIVFPFLIGVIVVMFLSMWKRGRESAR